MKTMIWKRWVGALSLIGLLLGSIQPLPAIAAPVAQDGPTPNGILVSGPVAPAETAGLPPALPAKVDVEVHLERQSALPVPKTGRAPDVFSPDPLVQVEQGLANMPAPILNFEGIANTGVLPPDTDGQIGPDHYVQIVNTAGAGSAVRVFDKTDGAQLYNFDMGNLWPVGTVCQRYAYGDPVVLYDQLADRWLLTQFVYGAVDFHECFAVSKGHTPTNLPDDWWLYDFTVHIEKFNDYPKIGVWPDGYYMMAHQFTTTWAGTGVWVFDREKMLLGEAATFQYKDLFGVNPNLGGMLPSNWMGSTPPPPGSPNYFVEVDRDWSGTDDILTVFGFHVDWDNPANTSFDVVGELVVEDFNIPVCSATREQCIDQPDGAPRLEAIGDRLMMHAWYRNNGDHESLVFNHTVNAGDNRAGIRWYELRKTVPAPTAWNVYQQGTYAPGSEHRWMGSIAMDHVGNIALGYSVSSTSVYPSIRYAGRLSNDPLNELPQAEVSIIEGGGVQTHPAARWGDYSAMSVDPVDNCTFWYTQEYIPAGDTTWHTRIASFRFPNCSMGDMGTLQGTVTDAATAAPIQRAAIEATAGITQTSGTTTEEDGTYTLPLLVGVYDVTASAYGYQSQTVSGVEIVSGTLTTQDFALAPAAFYTVTGTVTDAAAGWPLYARISISGYPGDPVWTDPLTGVYSISLAADISYTFQVDAFVEGYLAETRPVGPLAGDRVENFALQADAGSCLAPGYTYDYVYFEDFELSDGAYTITGTSSWAWGEPISGPGAAYSGTNAWATNLAGNYGPGEDGYLTSPPIDLSAYAGRTPILEWQQWLRSEANFDRASVEVSQDGGATWERVYGEVSGAVDEAWTRHSIVLDPGYTVADFRVRFFFHSDSSVFFPGWYVDDVGLAMVDYTPPAEYFQQGFEDDTFPPPGWASLDLDGAGTQWERSGTYFHEGLFAARHNFGSSAAGMQDGWLVTPPIDLPATPADLSFWERTIYTSDYYKHSLWICTGDCDAPPANFSEVAEFSAPVNAWRQQTLSLADYAGQTITLAFRYEGTFADSWYIDDIEILEAGVPPAPAVACVVQPGGLVTGNVYDGNTGGPLPGATVTNDSGEATTTVPTPLDPAVDDAFYTLFSPEGSHVFTATMEGGYQPAVETVTVVLSGTVGQDFTLSAAALNVSPAALQATLELGQSLTETLTLSNTGETTATFEIVELPLQQVSGLQMDVPEWSKTRLPDAKRPVEQPRNRQATSFILGNVYLAAETFDVLILTPDVGSGGGNVNLLLAALAPFTDLNVTVWDPDANGTPEAVDLLSYDVVILGNDIKWLNMDKAATGDAVAGYIDAGGKVIEGLYVQSPDDWGFAGRYVDEGYSPFTRATRDLWGPDQMTPVDPAHLVMLGVNAVNDLWGHQDPGLAAGAARLADWSGSGEPYIAVNENVVALNQLLHHQSNWTGDVGIVLHNAVLWLKSAAEDGVPWLDTIPVSGTIGMDEALPVQVSFDAGAVDQPGAYHALLRVNNDTPTGPLNVPVTMTVTAPPNYGLLTGAVSGLPLCDQGEAEPIPGAEVSVWSSAGVSWTVTTGAQGIYNLWADQAGSAYTLSAAAPGFLASQPVTATVTGGITTTVNFTLRRDAPCLSLSPDQFDVRVAAGAQETRQLTLENRGAAAATFELSESAGRPFQAPSPAEPGIRDIPPLVDGRSDRTDMAPQLQPSRTAEPLEVAGWGTGAPLPGAGRYRAASACNANCTQVWVFGGGVSGDDGTGSSDVMFYDAATDIWTTNLAPIPNPAQNWQAVFIDGKFYLPGGFDGNHHNWLQIYDVASDTWSAGANMPAATTPMAAALGGKLYIFGGNPGPSANVAMYDPLSDAWSTGLSPMPTARSYGRAVAAGEYIYVAGGANPTAAVERYHPATDTWETLPGLSIARGDASLFAAGDYLYAVGGIDDYLTWVGLTIVERYPLLDAPGGSWETLPAAPAGIGAAAFGCAVDKMWSIGGQDGTAAIVTTNRYLDEGLPCLCGAAASDVPWLDTEPITGTVEAGASLVVDITFTALPTMTAGVPYSATLWVRTNDPLLGNASVPITMTIGDTTAQVDLEPEVSIALGEPGASAVHRLMLTNGGSQEETYLLEYSGQAGGWGVELLQTTYTVAPGEQVEVLLRVFIPPDAGSEDQSVISVMATAQSDPSVSDTVEIHTFILQYRFYIPVLIQ